MATLGGCGDGYELRCYRIKESKRSPDERKRHPGFPLDPHIAEPVIGRRIRADPLAYAGYFFCLRRQHGPSDSLRQRDRTEKCVRIKVILAGFIDNPKHVVFLGNRIAQRDVDFAFLERDRIAIVFHADDQLFCLCLCHVSKQVLDLEFLAADAGGLVAM
jgi:hypothetical protein